MSARAPLVSPTLAERAQRIDELEQEASELDDVVATFSDLEETGVARKARRRAAKLRREAAVLREEQAHLRGHGPSLNQVLRALGYRTEPGFGFAKRVIRVEDGAVVFCGRAGQTWTWLGVSP